MVGPIGLASGMGFSKEARAEVAAAAALGDQTKVPRADGELTLALLLEQSHQFSDQLREDLAHKWVHPPDLQHRPL